MRTVLHVPRRRAAETRPPPVWALAPPRFAVLLAGFVVAAVATPYSGHQVVVSVVGVAWVAVTVALAVGLADEPRPGSDGRLLGPWVAAVDAVLVLAAVAVSGGADSPLRWLLLVAPACWASARDPRLGLLEALGAAGYLVTSIGDIARGTPGTATTIAGFYAIYGGAVVVAGATVRARRRETALEAAVAQGREDADRRVLEQARTEQERLVLALHDGPLQLAVTVSQDLAELSEDEPIDLDETRRTLRDAIEQMRTLTGELYGAVLRDSGLAVALGEVAEVLERRGGPPTVVTVGADTAGSHDELVMRVVHELLSNAAKHARATGVTVSVVQQGDPAELVVIVTDDGIGLDDVARRRAAREDHIGLTSVERDVRAAHGTMGFEQPLHGGTTVRVRLPGTAEPAVVA
ncbi:sensor histidine kinase [Patulibacter sp.]|uniref:sensor histidine kinase n=1 Tax=Patulibacter sp. TaxID=1912859 RepID=UPI00271BB362|nr:ATP-binding protein [Patulibacter sp.]MDO9409346.1 ATP-binding protein [Patulibacter sp.]